MKVANRLGGAVLPYGNYPSSHDVAAINRESAALEHAMVFRRGAASDQEVHSVCVCV